MNHCIECGHKVSRGGGNRYGDERCMVCETRRVFDGWRFETAQMKIRRQAKEHRHDHPSHAQL